MIIPVNWAAPSHVKAYATTRQNGYSLPPYASLNLGAHVGDDPVLVAKNRQHLQDHLHLPQAPNWLEQTHSTCACNLDQPPLKQSYDASYSRTRGKVCAVLTADCLPLLVCDKKGTQVAAIHAGWRGLLAGIIEKTLKQAGFSPNDSLVWLGAAISSATFEVGKEVYQAFVTHDPAHQQAFIQGKDNEHYYADIYQLARQRLQTWGLDPTQITGGDYCTYRQNDLFFSYRRDGQTGRIASLIYLEPVI